jgi:hypothetical protein
MPLAPSKVTLQNLYSPLTWILKKCCRWNEWIQTIARVVRVSDTDLDNGEGITRKESNEMQMSRLLISAASKGQSHDPNRRN